MAKALGRNGLGMLEEPKGQGSWSATEEDGEMGRIGVGRVLPHRPLGGLCMGMTGSDCCFRKYWLPVWRMDCGGQGRNWKLTFYSMWKPW